MATVCRVCLTSTLNLRPIQSKLLINVYNQLSSNLFLADDARSRSVCCFCYQKLLKCYMFSKMVKKSEAILTELMTGALITDDAIANLNSGVNNLSVVTMPSPITIFETTSGVTVKIEPLFELTTNDYTTEFSEDFVKEELIVQQVIENNKTTIEVSVSALKKPDFVKEEAIHPDHGSEREYTSNQVPRLIEIELQDSEEHKNIDTKDSRSNIINIPNFICSEKSPRKTKVCSVCHKQFSEKSRLVRHMRIHTGEKPFICTICNEQFTQKANLSRHIKIHTGEKPFSCSICGKSFRQNSHLAHHTKSHTGEKPNACSFCDKQFRCKGHLADHLRIHTGERPFSCSVCDKQFIHKSDMTKHMRIHTGEKPFSCSMCEKKFSQRGHLVEHVRTHTGEKPYACSECSIPFRHKSCLVKHMKVHGEQ